MRATTGKFSRAGGFRRLGLSGWPGWSGWPKAPARSRVPVHQRPPGRVSAALSRSGALTRQRCGGSRARRRCAGGDVGVGNGGLLLGQRGDQHHLLSGAGQLWIRRHCPWRSMVRRGLARGRWALPRSHRACCACWSQSGVAADSRVLGFGGVPLVAVSLVDRSLAGVASRAVSSVPTPAESVSVVSDRESAVRESFVEVFSRWTPGGDASLCLRGAAPRLPQTALGSRMSSRVTSLWSPPWRARRSQRPLFRLLLPRRPVPLPTPRPGRRARRSRRGEVLFSG